MLRIEFSKLYFSVSWNFKTRGLKLTRQTTWDTKLAFVLKPAVSQNLTCADAFFFYPRAVCELHKNNVRQHRSIKERNSLCTCCPHGNSTSVQSHTNSSACKVRQKVRFLVIVGNQTRAFKSWAIFHLCSYNSVGGPHTRLLPPPREVIDHDNAVKSIPHMTNFKPVQPTAPTASVEPVPFPLDFYLLRIHICTRISFWYTSYTVLGLPHLLGKPERPGFRMRSYGECISLTITRQMNLWLWRYCVHFPLVSAMKTCRDCGASISACPLCRQPITTRLRLFTWAKQDSLRSVYSRENGKASTTGWG